MASVSYWRQVAHMWQTRPEAVNHDRHKCSCVLGTACGDETSCDEGVNRADIHRRRKHSSLFKCSATARYLNDIKYSKIPVLGWVWNTDKYLCFEAFQALVASKINGFHSFHSSSAVTNYMEMFSNDLCSKKKSCMCDRSVACQCSKKNYMEMISAVTNYMEFTQVILL